MACTFTMVAPSPAAHADEVRSGAAKICLNGGKGLRYCQKYQACGGKTDRRDERQRRAAAFGPVWNYRSFREDEVQRFEEVCKITYVTSIERLARQEGRVEGHMGNANASRAK